MATILKISYPIKTLEQQKRDALYAAFPKSHKPSRIVRKKPVVVQQLVEELNAARVIPETQLTTALSIAKPPRQRKPKSKRANKHTQLKDVILTESGKSPRKARHAAHKVIKTAHKPIPEPVNMHYANPNKLNWLQLAAELARKFKDCYGCYRYPVSIKAEAI